MANPSSLPHRIGGPPVHGGLAGGLESRRHADPGKGRTCGAPICVRCRADLATRLSSDIGFLAIWRLLSQGPVPPWLFPDSGMARERAPTFSPYSDTPVCETRAGGASMSQTRAFAETTDFTNLD